MKTILASQSVEVPAGGQLQVTVTMELFSSYRLFHQGDLKCFTAVDVASGVMGTGVGKFTSKKWGIVP